MAVVLHGRNAGDFYELALRESELLITESLSKQWRKVMMYGWNDVGSEGSGDACSVRERVDLEDLAVSRMKDFIFDSFEELRQHLLEMVEIVSGAIPRDPQLDELFERVGFIRMTLDLAHVRDEASTVSEDPGYPSDVADTAELCFDRWLAGSCHCRGGRVAPNGGRSRRVMPAQRGPRRVRDSRRARHIGRPTEWGRQGAPGQVEVLE